jgi:hypothetical protein
MEITAPQLDHCPVDPTLAPTIRAGERGFGGVAESGAVDGIEWAREMGDQ